MSHTHNFYTITHRLFLFSGDGGVLGIFWRKNEKFEQIILFYPAINYQCEKNLTQHKTQGQSPGMCLTDFFLVTNNISLYEILCEIITFCIGELAYEKLNVFENCIVYQTTNWLDVMFSSSLKTLCTYNWQIIIIQTKWIAKRKKGFKTILQFIYWNDQSDESKKLYVNQPASSHCDWIDNYYKELLSEIISQKMFVLGKSMEIWQITH